MRIKQLVTLAILFHVASLAGKTREQSDIYGVWVGEKTELVRTKKYTLIFHEHNGKIEASLRENKSEDGKQFTVLVSGYSFDIETKEYRKSGLNENSDIPYSDLFKLENGKLFFLTKNGNIELEQIEKLAVCEPYEMPYANKSPIAECLQNWQLGVFDFSREEKINIQIGTNKHSYIYNEEPDMVYLRGARLRHNNNGSLFAQNIRLMINKKSGEKTAFFEKDNKLISSSDLEIDDSLFQPDVCTFDKSGIYWSFISASPTVIRINGCGEEYKVSRPEINNTSQVEWFEYKPY